jgi:hypothetical protein
MLIFYSFPLPIKEGNGCYYSPLPIREGLGAGASFTLLNAQTTAQYRPASIR